MIHFLVHGAKDNVAVAVTDVGKGISGVCMNIETRNTFEVTSRMEIPLGHKIALTDLNVNDTVFKYDNDIGRVVSPIKKGEHVHVHNVKTKRW